MTEIYIKMLEQLKAGRTSVAATIVRQGGPSPRGLGTRCLILDDGALFGTIGGGILEAKTLEEARRVLKTGEPVRLRFSMSGTDVAKTDMLCGGEVEIFLEPVSPESEVRVQVAEEMIQMGKRGEAGLLATAIDPGRWGKETAPLALLLRDGGRVGWVPGGREAERKLAEEAETVLDSGRPSVVAVEDESGDRVEFFLEPIESKPALYVFGGGHVSRQIVPLAALVGFRVVVIDDREEFTLPQDFPEADRIHLYPFEGVLDRFEINDASYIVIVTRGHMHDKDVLVQALRTEAKYIGMIGSRRKRGVIYAHLLDQGFTQEDLDRVHSPIGLDIGAETPEEIGVSIVAELIRVRAGSLRREKKGKGREAGHARDL